MNAEFTITRWPNAAGLMRGPNMMTHFCQKCQNERTHGFTFYDRDGVTKCMFFVCDDCLKSAKAETR